MDAVMRLLADPAEAFAQYGWYLVGAAVVYFYVLSPYLNAEVARRKLAAANDPSRRRLLDEKRAAAIASWGDLALGATDGTANHGTDANTCRAGAAGAFVECDTTTQMSWADRFNLADNYNEPYPSTAIAGVLGSWLAHSLFLGDWGDLVKLHY